MNKNKCKYAAKCGGCDYQDFAYETQLKKKQETANKFLKEFGKVEPIIGADNPYNYRNKIHGVFGKDKNGNIFTGIYESGSHKIVPVKECQIEDKRAAAIMATVCTLIKSFKMQVYDEDRRTGLFRHILIRTAQETGQIMVVLVLANQIFPSKNNFVKELKKAHPEITTVVHNVNNRNTNMVIGDKNIALYGPGYIEDILCGLKFRISPSSFYQINPKQTEKLYGKAIELANLTGKERVIDAYCGIGTIGMTAATKAKEVVGVELNKDAVRDAIVNAKCNNMKNIRFLNDDAGKYMQKLAATGEKVDVVLMDPPRSGSTKEFIDSVKILSPKRVVYVSCNVETQARDLKLFKKYGYKVQRIVPLDMFPFTMHVECVCLLSRVKN